MRTVGEIEAAAGAAVCQFMKELHGCGAKVVRARLVDEAIVVFLGGVMTRHQERLAREDATRSADYRASLRRCREEAWQVARESLATRIEDATASRPVSMLHDFSPDTGDEVIVLCLDGRPATRGA